MKTHHKLNYEEYLLLSIKFLITGTLLHFHNSQCNLTSSFLWTFYLDFSITYLFLPTIFITYPFTLQSCQILFVMKRSRKCLFSNTIRVIFLKLKIQCTTVRSPGTKKHHSFVHRSNMCLLSSILAVSLSFCTLHMCN